MGILQLSFRQLDNQQALPLLQYLDLSYCNRITGSGVKQLKALDNPTYLRLQDCSNMSKGSLSKLIRNGLTIHP